MIRISMTSVLSVFFVSGVALAETPPADQNNAGAMGGQTYGTTKAADQPKDLDIRSDKGLDTMEHTQAAPAPAAPTTTVTLPPPKVTVVEPQVETRSSRPYTGIGTSISVGGGVVDFTDSDARSDTNVGGSWDARLTVGTRSMLALEAAYIGSAQDIQALGLDPDATLVSNGVEGDLRLNIGTYAIQPFVFGGVGWQRFSLVDESFNTSSVENDDDVVIVPVGAGLGARYSSLLLDARFTWRESFNENLMGTAVDMSNWSASGRVGFEF